jgi:hypothetical protein
MAKDFFPSRQTRGFLESHDAANPGRSQNRRCAIRSLDSLNDECGCSIHRGWRAGELWLSRVNFSQTRSARERLKLIDPIQDFYGTEHFYADAALFRNRGFL